MSADLWQRRAKISGWFGSSTSFLRQQSQNNASFKGKFYYDARALPENVLYFEIAGEQGSTVEATNNFAFSLQ